MRSYDDEHFSPPAPVARVTLTDPFSGRIALDVPMLLDSGADHTVLPAAVVAALGVEPLGEIETRVYNGTKSFSKVVSLHLTLGKSRFPGQYLLAHADVGFLGRDILNSLVLKLHGPDRLWSLRRR